LGRGSEPREEGKRWEHSQIGKKKTGTGSFGDERRHHQLRGHYRPGRERKKESRPTSHEAKGRLERHKGAKGGFTYFIGQFDGRGRVEEGKGGLRRDAMDDWVQQLDDMPYVQGHVEDGGMATQGGVHPLLAWVGHKKGSGGLSGRTIEPGGEPELRGKKRPSLGNPHE